MVGQGSGGVGPVFSIERGLISLSFLLRRGSSVNSVSGGIARIDGAGAFLGREARFRVSWRVRGKGAPRAWSAAESCGGNETRSPVRSPAGPRMHAPSPQTLHRFLGSCAP